MCRNRCHCPGVDATVAAATPSAFLPTFLCCCGCGMIQPQPTQPKPKSACRRYPLPQHLLHLHSTRKMNSRHRARTRAQHAHKHSTCQQCSAQHKRACSRSDPSHLRTSFCQLSHSVAGVTTSTCSRGVAGGGVTPTNRPLLAAAAAASSHQDGI